MLYIDGAMLKNMTLNAAKLLESKKSEVDALNVFPVPDGDTGTNMSLTINAAAAEVKKFNYTSFEKVADLLAMEALKGARGNSGVILSQLIRGFARSAKGREEVNAAEFAAALKSGVDTAYRAVMKPTEGTILTVAREAAEAALNSARKNTDIVEVLEAALSKGKDALARTPEMLPVLKQAGVVDAGGQGYIYILEGSLLALKGMKIGSEEAQGEVTSFEPAAYVKEKAQETIDPSSIEFGYCTEFIITRENLIDVSNFKNNLYTMGDSVLVIDQDEIVKVHVHTNHPGKVLEMAIELGTLSRIKIDNMREQHSSIIGSEKAEVYLQNDEADDAVKVDKAVKADEAGNAGGSLKPAGTDGKKAAAVPQKEQSMIAVAAGKGVENIFLSLGVDEVISGGQSMNPSTDDILKAIQRAPSQNVFVFPNNSNIILAANQAKELTDKNVRVVPTKNIPQGLSCAINFETSRSVDDNENEMLEAISRTKSGQVTFAVRNSNYNGKEINTGDILGLLEGKITVVGRDINQVVHELLLLMVDDESAVITIIYGEGVSREDADVVAEYASEKFDSCDVEIHDGGQPVYYYMIGVE